MLTQNNGRKMPIFVTPCILPSHKGFKNIFSLGTIQVSRTNLGHLAYVLCGTHLTGCWARARVSTLICIKLLTKVRPVSIHGRSPENRSHCGRSCFIFIQKFRSFFFKSEGDKFKIIRIRYVFTWYYWLISELTGVISYYAEKYALIFSAFYLKIDHSNERRHN